MTSMTGKVQRATHQSLPKLVIPKGKRPQPEEITPSRAVQFLAYCSKYKRAPPGSNSNNNMVKVGGSGTTPAPIQIIISGVAYNISVSTNTNTITSWSTEESFFSAPAVPASPGDDDEEDIPTLDFDRRDWRALRRKTEELEYAKEEHGYWIKLLKEDPRNHEILKHCRYWRTVREELGAEIQLIPERLRIRREFRHEYNRRYPE